MSHSWPLLLVACLLHAASPLQSSGQDIASSMRQVHHVHVVRDGLPQATAYQIEVDPRGWVWAATQGGIAYHNGSAWTALGPRSKTVSRYGLVGGNRIASDRSGHLWFATREGGAFRLAVQPGLAPHGWQWTRFTTADGLPSDTLQGLLVRQDGTVGLVTERGIATYSEGRWHTLPLPAPFQDHAIRAAHERADGSLWIATAQGALSLQKGRWHALAFPDNLDGQDATAIHEGEDGTLYFVTGAGIGIYDGSGWRVARPNAHAAARARSAAGASEDGSLWLGTSDAGTAILRSDGSWAYLDTQNGLPSDEVLSAASHPDGSLWIGTRNGIAVVNPDAWAALDRSNGLADANVWTIREMRDGSFWFGTSTGVSVYDRGTWRTLPGPEGRPLGSTRTILEASDGTVWCSADRRLLAYRAGRWQRVAEDLFVYDILERPDGTLLFGTRSGVFRYADGNLAPLQPEEPLLREPVKTLYEARDGTLWIGVHGHGLLAYRGGTRQFFPPADERPIYSPLDVHEDTEGLLWFATTHGLALYDGRTWRAFTDTTVLPLPDAFTYRVEQDTLGRYYVSTNRGIVRLQKHAPPPGADPSLDELWFTSEVYGLQDGLPSYEGNQNASLRDSRGRIWFGTIAGAAMYDPSQERRLRPAGAVTLDRMQIENMADSTLARWLAQPDGRRLSFRQNDIHFAYTLGTPGRPDHIRFRTRLVGYDAALTGWTASTTRTYTNLPSGDYTFLVYGRSARGIVGEPARFAFSIAPAPWATWWAYALYALLAALGIWGLVRWQTERIQRKHERAAAMEQERVSRRAAEIQAALLHSEKQRLLEANRASEFQRRVLEGTTNGIFALSLEGRFSLCNPRMEAITGCRAEDLEGWPLSGLFEGEDAERVEGALQRVLQEQKIVRDVAVTLYREDATRHLSLTLNPLFESGALAGAVGMAEDVTERRELEQFRDDMHHMLVHDLRSPLVGTRLMAQQMTEFEDLSSEDLREAAGQIAATAGQALSLVEAMLHLSRLESGKMPLSLERLDLGAAVERAAAGLRSRAAEQQVQITTKVPDDLPPVHADAFLLQRVLTNLLDNAVKFTRRGGDVTVRAELEEEAIRISVSDAGRGITPDLQNRLFQKFATGNVDGSGTGLGLAFCRLAVEAMRGRIWLDHTAPTGTTFRFTLPTQPTAATAPHVPPGGR